MIKQENLFNEYLNPEINIPGLAYIPDFITEGEHDFLLSHIDQQSWLLDIKRRVQHYGYKYDYKARSVDKGSYLGPLPEWLYFLTEKFQKDKIFLSPTDQVIVNEYLPGQGISAHIDCVPCFGDTIVSLSLGSSCQIDFLNYDTHEKKSMVLAERSILILSNLARYQWQHGIPARKSDMIDGIKIPRKRRVSLTFRTVLKAINHE